MPSTLPSAFRNPQSEQYAIEERRNALMLAGAIAIVLAVTAVGIGMFNRWSSTQMVLASAGEDRIVLEILESDSPREAIEWLNAHPSRMFSGMTRSQAEDRVRMLCSMGAKKAIAFGSGMTPVIAVELPAEPEKRRAIFDWQKRWHEQNRFRSWEDQGQNYLLIRLAI